MIANYKSSETHRPCGIKEERRSSRGPRKKFSRKANRGILPLLGAHGGQEVPARGLMALDAFSFPKENASFHFFHQSRIRLTTFPSLQKDTGLGAVTVEGYHLDLSL